MMVPKEHVQIMAVLTAAFLALLVTDVAREPAPEGMCRTEPIRRNLHRLQTILLFTTEDHIEALRGASECEQPVLMQSVVGLLKDYLLPHLAAEEAVLYPAAERKLPAAASLTSVLVREHAIMRRWIEEMEELATRSMPDVDAFIRRGERLLGLIESHFEADEKLLFPVLDEAPPAVAHEGARP